MSLAPAPAGVVGAVVRLVRALRARGMPVTPRDALRAAESLGMVDVLDREDVRLALKVVLVSRPEDAGLFDEVFASAWDVAGRGEAPPGLALPAVVQVPPSRRSRISLSNWMKPDEGAVDDGPPALLRAPSDEEVLATRDFSQWTPGDEAAFAAMAARIARRLVLRRSRRWRPGRHGAVDLRATLRGAVHTHGEPVLLRRRDRRLRKTRLLLLCDVSGSMEAYSAFLMQFVHALQNAFASVETFVFATRLSRVTHRLRRAEYREAMRHLGREVRDWSGGTRIGGAVATLVADHRRFLDRRTVVLLLSDGWDVGDPAELATALGEVRRRVRRVIWINPLMGASDFTPATRGMQAALPHIDLLAPGHNLASLEDLARALTV